jgi:nucleoside diphosphate kinase
MSQTIPRGMAAEFYAEHSGKGFFDGLLTFMTSAEVNTQSIVYQSFTHVLAMPIL